MVRYDARNARWAADLIAEAGRLLEAGEDARAFRLLRQAEPYIQGHPELLQARDALLLPIAVRPDPPGADVYVKPYADGDGPWERLGRTPLETRGPLGFFRWRVTRAGFTPFEGAAPASMGEMKIVLMPDGAVPSGMVPIPEGTALAGSGESIRLAPFYLDRFEVTNREFKRFADEGGYRKSEYWTEPFVKDGRVLSFDDAMSEFRDATGRPGRRRGTWDCTRKGRTTIRCTA